MCPLGTIDQISLLLSGKTVKIEKGSHELSLNFFLQLHRVLNLFLYHCSGFMALTFTVMVYSHSSYQSSFQMQQIDR